MEAVKITLGDWADNMMKEGKMSTRLYNCIKSSRSNSFYRYVIIRDWNLEDVDSLHIMDLRNAGKGSAEEFLRLKEEYYSQPEFSNKKILQ